MRLGTIFGGILLFAATFAVVYYLNRPEPPKEEVLAGTGIEKMGGKPLIHYVYIPQGEVSDDRLFEAAQSYCEGSPGCEVHFWTDKDMTPSGNTETEAQKEAMFATYVKNRFNGEEVVIRKDREQAIRR